MSGEVIFSKSKLFIMRNKKVIKSYIYYFFKDFTKYWKYTGR